MGIKLFGCEGGQLRPYSRTRKDFLKGGTSQTLAGWGFDRQQTVENVKMMNIFNSLLVR